MDEGGSQVFVKLPGKVKNGLKTFRGVTIDLMIDDFCSGSITNWAGMRNGRWITSFLPYKGIQTCRRIHVKES
jgi:hypothetical protein